MNKYLKDHGQLVFSILLSILILIVLLWLQSRSSTILKLENRWLIVAGIPILVALIAGGYIRKFKGFGIELEARLKKPITSTAFQARETLTLKASDVMERREEIGKHSVDELHSIPQSKRLSFERLSFVIGKKRFYSPDAITYYLNDLPNVKYIEVQKQSGEFICLFPKESFWPEKVEEFINSIESDNINETFGEYAISKGVTTNESLLEVLPKVRASRLRVLPVLDGGKLVGVIEYDALLERLADEVIAAES
jgi:CBS domain-containing protein